jgi:hypothetical protein
MENLLAFKDVFAHFILIGNHRRDGSIVGLKKATRRNGNCSNLLARYAKGSLSVAKTDEVVEKVLCAILRLCYDIFCERKSSFRADGGPAESQRRRRRHYRPGR